MNTPADRLLAARKAAGFDGAREFSKSIGVPYTTYKSDENGKRRIKESRARIYAAALGISTDELLKGNVNSSLPENSLLSQGVHALRQIPLLDITDLERVGALIDGRPLMPERLIPSPLKLAASGRAVAFIVPNQALSEARPRPILEGDVAYIDPEAKWATGDIVAARVEGYPEIVIRKYREVIEPDHENAFELVATSDDFQSLASTRLKITVIGKLVGLWMSA